MSGEFRQNNAFDVKLTDEELIDFLRYQRARELKNLPSGQDRLKGIKVFEDIQMRKALEHFGIVPIIEKKAA